MVQILFKASSLTSTSSGLIMEYRRFSGSKQNVLPCKLLMLSVGFHEAAP